MRVKLVPWLVVFFGLSLAALSEEPEIPRYQLPPRVMIDLVDAPETPDVITSPDRGQLLILQKEGLPTIDELAELELRLAGIRIDPKRYGPSRGEYFNDASLLRIDNNSEVRLTGLPGRRESTEPVGRRTAAMLLFRSWVKPASHFGWWTRGQRKPGNSLEFV